MQFLLLFCGIPKVIFRVFIGCIYVFLSIYIPLDHDFAILEREFIRWRHTLSENRKIVYVDMDNVLVDFPAALSLVKKTQLEEYEGRYDEIPGIFSLMPPMRGAIEAYEILHEKFDTYILSTAPWENPSAWSDKLLWVKTYLPCGWKRLILTHHKNLNRGDFLIDDRVKNGAGSFEGKHIHFGTKDFPNWDSVLDYLIKSTHLH